LRTRARGRREPTDRRQNAAHARGETFRGVTRLPGEQSVKTTACAENADLEMRLMHAPLTVKLSERFTELA
jgi:hypothetical protein